MAGSAYGFFLAFRDIPLAEGYLVYFTAPFFTLLLAALVLDERNGRAVWFWSAIGFLGVMVAMYPALTSSGAAAGIPWHAYAWAFLGTMTYAGFLTLSRKLRTEQNPARLIFWSSGPLFLAILPFAIGASRGSACASGIHGTGFRADAGCRHLAAMARRLDAGRRGDCCLCLPDE
jgi:drug/metabolite transporter (DMT)-like permease